MKNEKSLFTKTYWKFPIIWNEFIFFNIDYKYLIYCVTLLYVMYVIMCVTELITHIEDAVKGSALMAITTLGELFI